MIESLRAATFEQLRDVEFLSDVIRGIGLYPDPRPEVFGPESVHCKGGLYQLPQELAAFLIYLSDKGIKSIIEIGTFRGAAISVLYTYLNRFNLCTAVTVDPNDWQPTLPDGVTLHRGTSADFAGKLFDLAFIDGDHAYKSALYDYENVGKNARYCVFHDIVDKFIRADYPCGGVPHLWEDIKHDRDTLEFVNHPLNLPIMGIGVIDQDVRFLVSSHMAYQEARTRLVAQLLTQTAPDRILCVVAGAEQPTEVLENGVRTKYVTHNSFEYTGLIELDEPGRWFLLHDTCTLGPDFVSRVYSLPRAEAVAVSLMGHNNGANGNIGLYDSRYLATKREYLDSMKDCTKSRAVTEEGNLYNWAEHMLVDSQARIDGTTQVYGGIDRLTEYYSSVDLYKHKANWGQSPVWFTGP